MCAAVIVKVHVKVNGSTNVVEKEKKKKERLEERRKAFFTIHGSTVRLAAIISEPLIFLNLSATGDGLQAFVTIPVRDTKMIFADGLQREM